MEDPDLFLYPLLALFIVTLLLYIIFSGAEQAFNVLRTGGVIAETKSEKRSHRIKRLLEESNSVSVALKVGHVISRVALSGVVFGFVWYAVAAASLYFLFIFAAATLYLCLIQFLVRELWTARFVAPRSNTYFGLISLPVLLYFRLVRPLCTLISQILDVFNRKFKLEDGPSHHRILAVVNDSEDSELEDNERAMIHSIIEFGETEVHEIMVPRTDMEAIEEHTDLENLTQLIRDKGHSRLPLYSEDIDHILGIVHVKDLLSYPADAEVPFDLKSLAREAYYVPENKRIDDLLRAFQKEKHHMAIVVDEYGGTAGLVTLEDVIEEIVGDIQDEYDQELPLVVELADNSYLIDAKIDLHDLNQTLSLDLPTEGEYESLGGFILSLTGYVPSEKEQVDFGNYTFLIEEVDRNRIVGVKLKLLNTEELPSVQDREL